MKKTKRYYRYFSMLSNETLDSMAVLQLYRNKDLNEKALATLPETWNLIN